MIDNSTKDKLKDETPHFGNTLLYAVADLKRYSTIVVDPPWKYGKWGKANPLSRPNKGQNGNVYAINGKCKTLSAGVGITGNGIGSSNAPKIEWNNEQGWRRLTATECERLQTVPDNYTNCVSDTQRYKMLGNGWTVDVIAHIFCGLS